MCSPSRCRLLKIIECMERRGSLGIVGCPLTELLGQNKPLQIRLIALHHRYMLQILEVLGLKL